MAEIAETEEALLRKKQVVTISAGRGQSSQMRSAQKDHFAPATMMTTINLRRLHQSGCFETTGKIGPKSMTRVAPSSSRFERS